MRRWFTRARDDIDCRETRGKERECVCVRQRERERETSDKEEAREGRRRERGIENWRRMRRARGKE